MKASDIMTREPAVCLPQSTLRDAAQIMVEEDCGAVPVVENRDSMRLVGIITDRDIACRAVADGAHPLQKTAGDCMSSPVVTVTPDASLEECCEAMEENQIRRVPVVDRDGVCVGVVTQAHIARRAPESDAARVVRNVSEPTREASRVG
ncbi:MAG: CBS domain-containing protein [Elusimicrobiota bacterium]